MDDYSLLNVSPNATKDEIVKAFRRVALQSHPDKNGTNEDFQMIHDAYQRLLDKKKMNNF